MILGPERKITL